MMKVQIHQLLNKSVNHLSLGEFLIYYIYYKILNYLFILILIIIIILIFIIIIIYRLKTAEEDSETESD